MLCIVSGVKIMEYEQMDKQIIQGVGGKENVKSVIHCATRLRFVLYDESKADDKKIENIPGILQLVKHAGQYQIVIGGHIEDVYNKLIDMLDFDDVSNNSYNPQKLSKKQSSVDKLIETVTGILSPAIPLLAGAGMGKVLLLVLNLMGVLSSKGQTYIMLNLIFDTGYYFMPAFIGFSAAKVFKPIKFWELLSD
jgi:Phosphotransferase system IIB components